MIDHIELQENKEIEVRQIPMSQIDTEVIPAIRDVKNVKHVETAEPDESSSEKDGERDDKKDAKEIRYEENYQVLENSLIKDGQLHPITVRKLTDEEKSQSKSNAEYGIIDGHHRFAIAKKLGQENILAEIYEVKGDENQSQKYLDKCLAFRLNVASIKMTPAEKGKVISELRSQFPQSDKSEKEIIEKIGKEIFGLKIAMAYRCVAAYNKEKKSDDKAKESADKTDQKSKDVKMSIKDFKEIFHKDIKSLTKVISKQSSLKDILSNTNSCDDTLAKIAQLEKDLKWVKKRLNEAKANMKKTENQSAENETDNGKNGLPSEDSAQ